MRKDSLRLKKQLLGNLALTLVSIAVTLGIAEAGLRLFARNLASEPVTSNQYNFYRYDPVLGWSNLPGARGVFARPEFSYDLRINSFGLRGDEISMTKPEGVRRVAVLGDSFVWGIGAADPELFTNLLAAALPSTEVLNFGVAGYSLVQYHLLTGKVLSFDPDVVVISFCLGNDFEDAVFWQRYDYYKPFARLDDNDQLVIDGYPIPDVKRFPTRYDSGARAWLHDRSFLLRLAGNLAARYDGGRTALEQRGPADFVDGDIYLQPDKSSTRHVVRINARLLQEISTAYRARGIPVIVLAAPTKCELGQCYSLKDRSDASRRLLQEAVSGLPVTYIDPGDGFGEGDFWSDDAHWRPAGHRKIAGALLPAVTAALTAREDPAR